MSKKRPVKFAGDLCRKCETPVIFTQSKFHKDKLLKPYYFNAYLKCPKCLTFYMLEEFKIVNLDYDQNKNQT